MAKWKLTDASAKRIFADYAADDSGGDRYTRLRAAVKRDGQQGFNAMGQMLAWIGDNHPRHLIALADSVAYLYERLRDSSRKYLDSLDALANCCDYKHYHQHDETA